MAKKGKEIYLDTGITRSEQRTLLEKQFKKKTTIGFCITESFFFCGKCIRMDMKTYDLQ